MHLFYKLNHCAMLYRKKRPKLLELYIHLENYLITTTVTGIKNYKWLYNSWYEVGSNKCANRKPGVKSIMQGLTFNEPWSLQNIHERLVNHGNI